MKATVVCISHTDGALGMDVGQAVAKQLGFTFADDAIILAAAKTEGLLPESVSRAESRKAGRTLEVDFGRFEKTEDVREMIRSAVLETAKEGGVVITSHAASYALSDRDDVLRVFVTASDETRSERVSDLTGLDAKKAAKQVDEADKARADYIQRFYGVKRELPTDYDIVVSTDRLTPDEAAAVVAGAASG